MKARIIVALVTLIGSAACSSLGQGGGIPAIPGTGDKPYRAAFDIEPEYVSSVRVNAPSQCFSPENQSGAPVFFHQQSIIDQPRLVHREALAVPSSPRANRNFYCAAFSYSVDARGRVTDVQTLYNSHPGVGGIDFAREARSALRQWRYEPGLVDKGPQKFTGLTTVFYYGFNN